uniref:Enoyl-CoA hydratase (EC) n=1 Tax=uncultured Thiotrichaceae bacterium TaxID=298394 RepID=A0A6S6UJ05_9GAMM|nr:MAG: Enoyl-CoA hydratase (EC [uncultured Thiotrichaceae bacterium]
MSDVVTLTVEGRVATMSLNRPDVLNTLNDEMAHALKAITTEVAADDAVRCLIVRGEGGHFMAGGDIAYFSECIKVPVAERHPEITKIIATIHEAIVNLREMPKPVVASVSGAVAGFGMSLMAACDLAVAADNTKFASAYCQLGVSPDGGGTFFLPRMVGDKRAREIMFLGERITAEEALAMELVNKVVSVGELAGVTGALAQRLANGPRDAIIGSKRLLNSSVNNTLGQQLLLEQQSFADCAMSADFEEGVRAFIEKRPADFS